MNIHLNLEELRLDTGRLSLVKFLVINVGTDSGIQGDLTKDPSFGLPSLFG